jgi:hypothetical protein
MNLETMIFEFFHGIGKSLSLWKVGRLEKKYLCHPYAEGSHCNKRHLKIIRTSKEGFATIIICTEMFVLDNIPATHSYTQLCLDDEVEKEVALHEEFWQQTLA